MISQLSKCDDLQNFANPKFSAKHGGWTNVYGNNRHPDNSLNDGQILFNALYSYGNRTKDGYSYMEAAVSSAHKLYRYGSLCKQRK